MGEIKKFKCSKCGNEWSHYCGVGFANEKIKGTKKNNTTGDADKEIKCPKCGSTDFEEDDIIALWD